MVGGLLGWMVACKEGAPHLIRIGGLFDLTGATSEVSIPYAEGIRDYVLVCNEQGGINGRRLELIDRDYGYNIDRARKVYRELVDEEDVLVVMGWGTGDTEALREVVAEDEIPFMSASYADSLTVVEHAPYNFVVGVTYSDQMRIALRFIHDNWTLSSRAARVAFVYSETPFGTSPIESGRESARELGLELVAEEVVSLSTVDATDRVLAMAEKEPDFMVVQESTSAASAIVQAVDRLELSCQIILLNWAADEKLIDLCGVASEGVMGMMPFVPFSHEIHGFDRMRRQAETRGHSSDRLSIRYVQGWLTMHVMAEGIRRCKNDLTGVGVRRGLESIQRLDLDGIAAPVGFSARSHKGMRALRICRVKQGKWVPETPFLEAR